MEHINRIEVGQWYKQGEEVVIITKITPYYVFYRATHWPETEKPRRILKSRAERATREGEVELVPEGYQIEYPHTNNDGMCWGCQAYQVDTMTFEDGSQLCPRCANTDNEQDNEEAEPYWVNM